MLGNHIHSDQGNAIMRCCHGGKDVVNYDVAQTAGMTKTRGDQFSHMGGV